MLTRGEKGLFGCSIVGVLGVVATAVLCLIGWVKNIIALIALANVGGPVTAMFVLRIVGIFFAPLGVILGWFF